ncbi:MAG: acyl-CoA thioesterase domain-containing protein, partial [Jatrophihabitans sp.]
MTDAPAYFLPLGDGRYQPTDATTSPWDDSAQHGGPPTALLATVIDRALASPSQRLARITVEFLGPIPRRELSVQSRVIRPGKRIALSEATMVVDGRPVAIARAWHVATGAAPPDGTRRPLPDIPALPAEQPQ